MNEKFIEKLYKAIIKDGIDEYKICLEIQILKMPQINIGKSL